MRAAIGPHATLVRHSIAPIPHRVIRETTAGLERMTLVYRENADVATERSCDVAIKRLHALATTDDPHRRQFMPSASPTHPNYWRREYDAYGPSSPIARLPAPLRVPRVYARDVGATTATLWLEAVESEPPAVWPDDRFYAIARAFGAWHAPNESPWFAHGSLRMWVPGRDSPAYAGLADAKAWAMPRVRDAFGSGARETVRDAWRVRDDTIAALESGPQRLAHNDLWTRNILATRGDVVVIDWSELGTAPLAHDLANLVLDSVWMFDLAPERLDAVERAVLAGYCDGAADVERAAVERAYRAGALVRFGLLAGALVRSAADGDKRDELAQRFGRSFDAIFDARAAVARAALAGPIDSYLK